MFYTHITEYESIAIEIYQKEGLNYSEISRKLGRSPSTIKREVERYKSKITGKYSSKVAIKQRKEKRNRINKENKQRIKNDEFLIKYILSKVKRYWSPEQISGRLKLEKDITISKDTIYKFIYENHPELIKKYFRRKGKKYQKDRKSKYQLMDRKMIDTRPEIVETKERIGDWEGDTVIGIRGGNKEVILTNVERKSGYLIASKIKDKSGSSVLNETIKLFSKIPKYKRKTITYDNGREFSEHKMIEYFTGFDVYFAHPYHSRERGTNENTNGLLRQFLPKKTDFQKLSKNQLKYFVSLINSRPRKRLNFLSPNEIFFN